jgi:uncharacterized protein YdaU (DUF1376 family)
MARWYRRCGADFIHGTMSLTLEEKGAYSLCLDLIYDRGAPIPDDARWISGVCGVSIRKWNLIRDRLILLGKLIAEDGHLINSRARFEIVSAEKFARNQAESGAKGGRKRVENEAKAKENSDISEASLNLTRTLNETIEDERIPVDKSTGEKSDFIDPTKFMFDAGIRLLGAAGISDGKARSVIGKWKRDHGDATVMAALGQAQRNGAIDPVAFVEGCFRARRRDGISQHASIHDTAPAL